MTVPGANSFDDLIDRLRAGDERAATQLFNRFASRLIGLVQKRTAGLLRQKLDPEDVLQSVFRSFFVRFAEGQFDLKNWDSLWSLLTLITLRKCNTSIDFFRASRRDVLREVPFAPGWNKDVAMWESLTREPSPTEAAVLTETVEHLLRGLDGREQEMATLHLQGYSVPEIGNQVGCSERSVHRFLAYLRKRAQRMHASEAVEHGSGDP